MGGIRCSSPAWNSLGGRATAKKSAVLPVLRPLYMQSWTQNLVQGPRQSHQEVFRAGHVEWHTSGGRGGCERTVVWALGLCLPRDSCFNSICAPSCP